MLVNANIISRIKKIKKINIISHRRGLNPSGEGEKRATSVFFSKSGVNDVLYKRKWTLAFFFYTHPIMFSSTFAFHCKAYYYCTFCTVLPSST